MSYNCDNVSYIGDGRLSISAGNAAMLGAVSEDDTPECCFINGMSEEGGMLESPDWSGDGSGRTYKTFIELLALTTGSADLLLQWEHGDSTSGLRVVDGKVTEHKVVFTLGKES